VLDQIEERRLCPVDILKDNCEWTISGKRLKELAIGEERFLDAGGEARIG
jgi:hypothetical protein